MAVTKKKKMTILSIVCGLLCAVCVFLYVNSVRQSAESARNEALARYGGEQVEVCVAKHDIAAGETVDSSSFEMKLWVADLLPENAVRSANEILGKQATTSILNGEVISSKRFQELPISLEVPAGLTAVSVPAKDVSAVGGALSAGMKIDVYATGNTSTTLIAQNVLVLATSTTFNESSSSASVTWVTLAVEPQIVQEIVAASQSTNLYFTLPSESSEKDDDSNTSNNSKDESSDKKTSKENGQNYDKQNQSNSAGTSTNETDN